MAVGADKGTCNSLPGASPVPLLGLQAPPDGRSSDGLSAAAAAAGAAAGAGLPHLSPPSPRGASAVCTQQGISAHVLCRDSHYHPMTQVNTEE